MHEPALRAAAFGGDPLPEPAVVRGSGTPRERLLAAIVLGAQGRYAAAAMLLDRLRGGDDPVTASLAASTLASHRRQLGGHRQARALDGEAFAKAAHLETAPAETGTGAAVGRGPEAGTGAAVGRSSEAATGAAVGREPETTATATTSAAAEPDPDGLDAAGARADALLGLAADNLALGRLAAARRLAERAAAEDSRWRATVRGGWVGAEIALAAGQGAEAVPHARRAFETARARGARRHAVKSGIVLAVALRAAGAPDHRKISDDLVGNAMAAAEECELLSLSWPAALVAADLRPGHAEEYRFRVAQVLHAVLRSADPCGRRVAGESPWVPVPGG
ncbi:hypothetical protein [Amycolatopsis sp. NPDC004625]|uniref:hypothetical protein n=1 Tax=Amycolatopsis sp. NPDC004625 TaxID=3154670 RepID=UPI00339FE7A1